MPFVKRVIIQMKETVQCPFKKSASPIWIVAIVQRTLLHFFTIVERSFEERLALLWLSMVGKHQTAELSLGSVLSADSFSICHSIPPCSFSVCHSMPPTKQNDILHAKQHEVVSPACKHRPVCFCTAASTRSSASTTCSTRRWWSAGAAALPWKPDPPTNVPEENCRMRATLVNPGGHVTHLHVTASEVYVTHTTGCHNRQDAYHT